MLCSASVLAGMLLVGACGHDAQKEPAPPSAGTLPAPSAPPCSLPDLSNAAEPVQQQIQERFGSLKAKSGNASTPPADLAAAYGEVGKVLLASEYGDAAESCFVNAAALAPTDMRWPYFLGHVYRLKNDPGKAAGFFERSLELQPQHVPALVWLGEMYLAQNRLDAADPPLNKALAIDPRSSAALYALGRVALARRDYAAAVKHLEASLALAPNASRIHYPLATAYRGQGDAARADAHLRRRGDVDVPHQDPLMEELGGLLQNETAYEVRASEAMNRKQWPQAVVELRKAIELAPRNPNTRLNLGTALYLTGDADGALEQFQTAVRLAPELPKPHFSIGVLMEARHRDEQAIEEFAAALKYDPQYVEARMQLADALRRTGRLEESLAHYGEVIRTSPGVSEARFGHAMALVRLGRDAEALERLSEAATIYPDQPGFAHARARLMAASPDDRIRDGRAALAIVRGLLAKQQTVGLMETMAMSLAELGRFDEAVQWQRDALASARQQPTPGLIARLTANLVRYERREPCRTPWQDSDPVFHPGPK